MCSGPVSVITELGPITEAIGESPAAEGATSRRRREHRLDRVRVADHHEFAPARGERQRERLAAAAAHNGPSPRSAPAPTRASARPRHPRPRRQPLGRRLGEPYRACAFDRGHGLGTRGRDHTRPRACAHVRAPALPRHATTVRAVPAMLAQSAATIARAPARTCSGDSSPGGGPDTPRASAPAAPARPCAARAAGRPRRG